MEVYGKRSLLFGYTLREMKIHTTTPKCELQSCGRAVCFLDMQEYFFLRNDTAKAVADKHDIAVLLTSFSTIVLEVDYPLPCHGTYRAMAPGI